MHTHDFLPIPKPLASTIKSRYGDLIDTSYRGLDVGLGVFQDRFNGSLHIYALGANYAGIYTNSPRHAGMASPSAFGVAWWPFAGPNMFVR